jgi:hypothetical protein
LNAYSDIGPAITLGHKFLKNRTLSIGITGHLLYRVATNPSYSLIDYVEGKSLGINSIGGEGAMFDFDLGVTYEFAHTHGFIFSIAGAMQNTLGGQYTNVSFTPLNLGSLPPPQPRSMGFGLSLFRPTAGAFSRLSLAFEVTDILNNGSGSFYRLLHLGGEIWWHSIALRGGVNQGYLGGGIGFDFRFFTLDAATYGEEIGLNAGTYEDRRYIATIGLHI